MSEIFIFQNKFHNFFSLKNQLKKHVVSYFCNLQLQYTNKRDSCIVNRLPPSSSSSSSLFFPQIKNTLKN
jgi:hypothetical protein